MAYTVYKHISPNGKVYIGITCQKPNRRWHFGHGYKSNEHFSNAIKKYGWSNFEHIIIAENLSKEDACSLEMELISKHKSNNPKYGYNISSGGDAGFSGVRLSDEAKKKIGDANRGEKHYLFGKHPTDDHRKHLSESRIGEKNSFYGKHHSPESKQKMGKAVICVETGNIYPTITEAEKATGIDKSTIVKACKHKKEMAGYFHWEYFYPEEEKDEK